MTPRERYLAAASRQPTDRPPLDLIGTASGLTDGAFFSLKELLGVMSADRQFRKNANVTFTNDEMLDALGVDARRVWMRHLPQRIKTTSCKEPARVMLTHTR